MADIWTNKTTTGTTGWTTDSDASTNWEIDDDGSVTQAWSDQSDSSLGASSNVQSAIGTATPAGSAMGTYDSAAEAATSLVGRKYHLFDDKEFFFGTDQDVRVSFDTAGGGMLIRVLPAQDEGSTLMTLRNGDVDIVKYKGDKSMQLSEATSLPSNPIEGSIIYSNNHFYLAT